MRMRLVVAWGVLVLASSCVLPAQSYGAFEEKAATTAGSVLSAVETTRLAVRVATDDRGFSPFLAVMLGEAEEEAASAQSTLGSIQPPDARSQALVDALDRIVEPAVKTLTALRIAARDRRLDDLSRGTPQLERASKELNDFLEAHG